MLSHIDLIMFSKLVFVLVALGSALHAAASPVASASNQTGVQPFAESHRVEASPSQALTAAYH